MSSSFFLSGAGITNKIKSNDFEIVQSLTTFFSCILFRLELSDSINSEKSNRPRERRTQKIEPKSGLFAVEYLYVIYANLARICGQSCPFLLKRKKEHTHWPNTKPKEP